MRLNLPVLLLASLSWGWALSAAAATDGQPGPSSQGSLQISLHIPPGIQLSGLQDVALRSNTSQPAQAQTRFCVYSRTGQYQLVAQGSGAQSSFRLTHQGASESSTSRPYALWVDDGRGPQPLRSGVAITGLRGADSQSLSCDNTGPNARLRIASQTESGLPQRIGVYQGTLTLTVAPE